MATENTAPLEKEYDQNVVSANGYEQEKSLYICHVHVKDPVSILCKDCESTVCYERIDVL